MRALVIGAGGFLGRALVAELQRRGAMVTESSSARPGGIDPQSGLLPPDFSVPRGTQAVYYLSQSPALSAHPPRYEHLLAVNVVSALHAARAAREAGVRHFLYASTGNVYAPSFAPLRETDAVRRDNWYSLSKVQAEEALLMLRPSLEVISLRLFGLYGPRQSGRLLPNLTAAIRAGRPVVIEPHPHDVNDREGLRISLTYVEDAVDMILGLARAQTCVSGPLNVAGDEVLSIRQIANTIARELGSAVSFVEAERPRACDWIADIERLKALELNTSRFTPFDEGIRLALGTHG